MFEVIVKGIKRSVVDPIFSTTVPLIQSDPYVWRIHMLPELNLEAAEDAGIFQMARWKHNVICLQAAHLDTGDNVNRTDR